MKEKCIYAVFRGTEQIEYYKKTRELYLGLLELNEEYSLERVNIIREDTFYNFSNLSDKLINSFRTKYTNYFTLNLWNDFNYILEYSETIEIISSNQDRYTIHKIRKGFITNDK